MVDVSNTSRSIGDIRAGNCSRSSAPEIQLNHNAQGGHAEGKATLACGRLQRPMPEDEADDRLIARAIASENDAFDLLIQRYTPLIIGFLVGSVASESDREDLLQETFLTAFANLGKLRQPDRFGPWLMKIARSKLTDLQRTEWRRSMTFPVVQSSGQETPRTDEVADTNAGPLADASYGQLRKMVIDALGRMGDTYRTVLYLRLIEGVAPQQIARQLGLKESTVRMRLMRGLKRLRKILNKKGLGLSGERKNELSSSDGF